MLLDLFLSALAVASLAVLVRNLLYNFPKAQTLLPRAITCGFCFTYWLSLVYVVFFDPLAGYLQNPFIQFVFSWLVLAFVTVVFRFSYVVIQETVNYFVHTLNARPHGHHHDETDSERHQ